MKSTHASVLALALFVFGGCKRAGFDNVTGETGDGGVRTDTAVDARADVATNDSTIDAAAFDANGDSGVETDAPDGGLTDAGADPSDGAMDAIGETGLRDTGSDAGSPDGGATPVGTCPNFVTPVRITNLGSTAVDVAISITDDELVAVYTSAMSGTPRLYMAERTTIEEPFSLPRELTELSTTNADEASISGDGLVLLYRDGAMAMLRQATRTSRTMPWGSVRSLTEYPVGTVSGFDLSYDGTRIVYTDLRQPPNMSSIFVATRANTAATFGASSLLTAVNTPWREDGPVLSASELEIWFHADTGGRDAIFRATRLNTASPFGPAEEIVSLATLGSHADPDISGDGRNLYFHSDLSTGTDYELMTARRDCPNVTCSTFSTPVEVPVINSTSEDTDPSVTYDEAVIVFTSRRAGSYALYMANRAGPAWMPPRILDELPLGGEGSDPNISADGLLLTYREVGTNHIVQSRRATRAALWGAPVELTELSSVPIDGHGTTGDARTIVYADSSRAAISTNILLATRATLADPFSSPTVILPTATPSPEAFPSITSDGLEIWFHAQVGVPDIHRVWRRELTDPWMGFERVSLRPDGGDPQLSGDRRTIYFSASAASGSIEIFVATRDCD